MSPHDLDDQQTRLVKEYAGNPLGLLDIAALPSSILHDLFDWSSEVPAAVDNRRQAAEALLTAVNNPAPPDGAAESAGAPAEGENTGENTGDDKGASATSQAAEGE